MTTNKQVEILIVSIIANTFIISIKSYSIQLEILIKILFYHNIMPRTDKGTEESANKMQRSTQKKGLKRKNSITTIATIYRVYGFLCLNAALLF